VRLSEDEYQTLLRRRKENWADVIGDLPVFTGLTGSATKLKNLAKRSKYRAVPTTTDGKRFASKAESKRYAELYNLWQAGEVKWFLRQVPLDLEGCTYRADFLVMWADGQIEFEDVKGFMTPVSALKIKQVEARWGIKIKLIRKERKCR
jgi:hypothetical protein